MPPADWASKAAALETPVPIPDSGASNRPNKNRSVSVGGMNVSAGVLKEPAGGERVQAPKLRCGDEIVAAGEHFARQADPV